MESVISEKVQKAMKLFDGFELHNRKDQVDLMAVVTFLRLKDNERYRPLAMGCSKAYEMYFRVRLAKMGIKPSDNNDYANSVRGAIASQDVNDANETLERMLNPRQPSWDDIVAKPTTFSSYLRS